MATDFLVTEELLDAVLAELRTKLPDEWLQSGATTTECALKVLEHGDLSDYCGQDRALLDDIPAIFVRPLGAMTDQAHGGTGGVEVLEHSFRLVHVRHFAQCYDDAGKPQENMTRARERYAKAISSALWGDAHKRLSNPTLTTATGSTAALLYMLLDKWDFGTDIGGGGTPDVAIVTRLREKGPQVWAIACDFSISVRVTPN